MKRHYLWKCAQTVSKCENLIIDSRKIFSTRKKGEKKMKKSVNPRKEKENEGKTMLRWIALLSVIGLDCAGGSRALWHWNFPYLMCKSSSRNSINERHIWEEKKDLTWKICVKMKKRVISRTAVHMRMCARGH